MRFAVRLAYKGTKYSGWQSQNNAITVQEVIESILYKKYRHKISVLGCGRTDKGVHASDFVMHFDFDQDIRDNFVYSLNKMLPNDIAIYDIREVSGDFHARFDAMYRSYVYKIHTIKNPFKINQSFFHPLIKKADFKKMQEASSTILEYKEFFPFCKTNTDVMTMKCQLSESKWIYDSELEEYSFHITSDRFLRGMVRLIVGMTINIGLGKIKIEDLILALDNQERLKTDWSVPAHGLYLNKIKYLDFD